MNVRKIYFDNQSKNECKYSNNNVYKGLIYCKMNEIIHFKRKIAITFLFRKLIDRE